MNEKGNMKTNEQETTPCAKNRGKDIPLKIKKTPQNSRKQKQDHENLAEKNKDDNSNLPPTEDKRPLF